MDGQADAARAKPLTKAVSMFSASSGKARPPFLTGKDIRDRCRGEIDLTDGRQVKRRESIAASAATKTEWSASGGVVLGRCPSLVCVQYLSNWNNKERKLTTVSKTVIEAGKIPVSYDTIPRYGSLFWTNIISITVRYYIE